MTIDDGRIDFHLECEANPVPAAVTRIALKISNDPTSTLKEQLLADCIFDLAKAFNEMIVSLEHGNAVVRVKDRNVHYQNPKDDPRRR